MADCELVGPCEVSRRYLHVLGCRCPARARKAKCGPGGVYVPRSMWYTMQSLHCSTQRGNIQEITESDRVGFEKGFIGMAVEKKQAICDLGSTPQSSGSEAMITWLSHASQKPSRFTFPRDDA